MGNESSMCTANQEKDNKTPKSKLMSMDKKSYLKYFILSRDEKKKKKFLQINLENKLQSQGIDTNIKKTMLQGSPNELIIQQCIQNYGDLEMKQKIEPQYKFQLVFSLTDKIIEILSQNDDVQQIVFTTNSSNHRTLNNFLDIFIKSLICCDSQLEKQKFKLPKNRTILILLPKQTLQIMNLQSIKIQEKVRKQLEKALL